MPFGVVVTGQIERAELRKVYAEIYRSIKADRSLKCSWYSPMQIIAVEAENPIRVTVRFNIQGEPVSGRITVIKYYGEWNAMFPKFD